MDVQVLNATDNPERLVCQAARGDYFDGYIGDTEYAELMKDVQYDESDVRAVVEDEELGSIGSLRETHPLIVEAKTRSFIRKQLDRGHFGPMEHAHISFAVKGVSRALMAQITRHRHLTFDVQSQRYVDFSDKGAIVPESMKCEEHVSRETGVVDIEDREHWRNEYHSFTEEAFDLYEEMVSAGVPKEDARFVLPIGTPVNFTMSGNLRSFMHVLNLRQKADAQWEIRQLSNEVADLLEGWAPYTGQWWQENGPMKLSP